MATQTTVRDLEQEDRQLLDEVWAALLGIGDATAKQLIRADEAMGKYTDRRGNVTAEAKSDHAGYALAWMGGIAAVIAGLNDDMDADEPIRLLQIIGDLIIAKGSRDSDFDRAYAAWGNLEAYVTGQWERDTLDYPYTKSEVLAVLHDANVKEEVG